MLIFEKTASEQAKIDKFIAKAEQDCQTLSEYTEYIQLETLEQVKKTIYRKDKRLLPRKQKIKYRCCGTGQSRKINFLEYASF